VSDRDPGLPNELEVDPEMALGADGEGAGGEGAEPVCGPIDDPEDPNYVEPASHAVPAPEDPGR
jgi:hypothetical protein